MPTTFSSLPLPLAQDGGGWFSRVFQVYMPREMCMYYEQDVVWTHVASDGLIALSYFTIPFALVYFVRRRRDVAFNAVFWLFAAFIFGCGLTHVFGVVSIWQPYYRLDGWVKAATGLISAFTAITLWRLMPQALTLPSPVQLREVNTRLTGANAELRRMQDELEQRVQDRTLELEERNEQLRREVSAREDAEAAERKLREEAQRLNRMKDEFLSTLSHELRTPLNAVMGWAQLLDREEMYSDPHEVREAAQTIYRNARAQSQLVDDLLDMSRIMAGRLRIEVEPLTLGEVVAQAVETMRPAAEARQLSLQVRSIDEAGERRILGDPIRLQQVTWNLLSNAVKFTPAGGRIDVEVEQVGSRMQLRVQDTGRGIPPEFLTRMFAPFEQLDYSTTRREGGLGLGLAIVRHLVELHGGAVSARSQGEGKGSTFMVDLPLRPVIEVTAPSPGRRMDLLSQPAPRAPSGEARLRGLGVLVVEDEADARLMLERVLQQAGAVVRSVTGAAEALELMEEAQGDGAQFDVIISDIGMPEMDGYELMRQWRAREAAAGGPGIPALALTAYARRADRHEALSAGFNAHLPKPVDHEELILQLEALGRHVRSGQ